MTTLDTLTELMSASLEKQHSQYVLYSDSLYKCDYNQIFQDFAAQIGVDKLTDDQKKTALLDHVLSEGERGQDDHR